MVKALYMAGLNVTVPIAPDGIGGVKNVTENTSSTSSTLITGLRT
jgi:hypothetical protein